MIQSKRSVLLSTVLRRWGLCISRVIIHFLAHSDVPAWRPLSAQHLHMLRLYKVRGHNADMYIYRELGSSIAPQKQANIRFWEGLAVRFRWATQLSGSNIRRCLHGSHSENVLYGRGTG